MQDSLMRLFESIGISVSADALIIIIAAITFVVGIYVGRLIHGRTFKQKEQELIKHHEKERDFFDLQLDQLSHRFNSLSQQALKNNNESFLTLAQQTFAQLQSSANNDLKTREQSIANLLQPIQRSMEQADQQLKQLDQDRRTSATKLGEQINNLLMSQHSLQSETRNLVSALRRPEVRGQWGELTLKRLVELAGMTEHCDFECQTSVRTDQGILRPDMLINLPSQRILVVDVKTPLDAYISATEATEADIELRFLLQHSRNVKQRIKELSQKQYWQQFEHSPDFVILFIPGDQFLSAALDQDSSLLEYALQHRILLATPTSLVGLLRAVAYGWSQDKLSKNSEQIRTLGENLHQRLQTLTQHLNKLGKHLDQSVEQYNKVLGSYQSKALPAVRKLSELGISNDTTNDIETQQTSPTRRLNDITDE
jgi:DNA recombination protein RmuC